MGNENWFKKHVDTVVVLGGIVASLIWMNSKFNNTDEKFTSQLHNIDLRLTRIETVLMMKGIISKEICMVEINESSKTNTEK